VYEVRGESSGEERGWDMGRGDKIRRKGGIVFTG